MRCRTLAIPRRIVGGLLLGWLGLLVAASGCGPGAHPRLRHRRGDQGRRQPGRDRADHRVGRREPDPTRHLSRLPDPLPGSIREPGRRRVRALGRAAQRRAGASLHRVRGQRHPDQHRQRHLPAGARRVHVHAALSHDPSARLLRGSRRAVLERDRHRLDLPDRTGPRHRAPSRRRAGRPDARRRLHRAARREGARTTLRSCPRPDWRAGA